MRSDKIYQLLATSLLPLCLGYIYSLHTRLDAPTIRYRVQCPNVSLFTEQASLNKDKGVTTYLEGKERKTTDQPCVVEKYQYKMVIEQGQGKVEQTLLEREICDQNCADATRGKIKSTSTTVE